VLSQTKADAVMIGRAAQGRPWIFREMVHFMATGQHLAPPLVAEVRQLLLAHLQDHYTLYGEYSGVRSARKHIGWYVKSLPGGEDFRSRMNLLETCGQQTRAVADFFDDLGARMDRMPSGAPNRLIGEEEKQMETTA
jgi:tRNA-dihydrouridine synthase B